MDLRELCADIVKERIAQQISVTGLTQDTRNLKPGNVFLALKGQRFDGREHIQEAMEKGASAILYERDNHFSLKQNYSIPVLGVEDLSKKISLLAAKFYQYPSEKMSLIGVTGTNGKTSCTHFIAQILESLGKPCGIVGTLGVGFPGHIETGTMTTPDVVTLQRNLKHLLDQKAQAVAMEVSSHALDQGRIQDVLLHTGIFTNLTQDHLDYHKTMEAYGLAKRKLFLQPHLKHGVINVDSDFGRRLAEEFKDTLPLTLFSCEGYQKAFSSIPQCVAENITYDSYGISAKIRTAKGEVRVKTPLYGLFNLSNLLATIAAVEGLGYDLRDFAQGLERIKPVAGRMEKLGGGDKPTVIVDYAHTPDALEQTILAIKRHNQGKIYTIFGCGGNRDSSKRPFMGKIAETYSDSLIVTNDNPREEVPEDIAKQILSGMKDSKKAMVELDRKKAIFHTIQHASLQDIVLVAGKGHEDYQDIQGKKHPFSDKEQVLIALRDYQ